jgi:hypothetical protein
VELEEDRRGGGRIHRSFNVRGLDNEVFQNLFSFSLDERAENCSFGLTSIAFIRATMTEDELSSLAG